MILYRNITKTLERSLKQSPVTLILGPRQIGKTTLVKQLAQTDNLSYVSFDDIRALASAQQDPVGFIEHQKKPVIFDEIQRVPELFLPIKQAVDSHRQPGMFILTGSANPLVAPKIADSLAGRMQIIHLWPLSQGEIEGREERFLSTIFASQLNLPSMIPFSRDQLLTCIVKGGYPVLQSYTQDMQTDEWCNSYLTTLLQRDVQDLARIEGLAQLPHLLKLLSTRLSGQLNSSELSRSSKLSTSTLNRYFVLLEALFLVYRQNAWSGNVSRRLVKAPKLYFVDTAIAAYLLNSDADRLKKEPQLLGALLENFVANELIKQTSWHPTRISCHHFRTQNGSEVDMVLEDKHGSIVGIEVKASQTVGADDFKGLKQLAQDTGKPFVRGIVLYTGNLALPFGPNMLALPINMLWQ